MTFTLDMFEDLSGIWPSNQLDYQYRIAKFESKKIPWKESSHKVVNYSVVGFDVTLERYTGKYFIGKLFVSAFTAQNESYIQYVFISEEILWLAVILKLF